MTIESAKYWLSVYVDKYGPEEGGRRFRRMMKRITERIIRKSERNRRFEEKLLRTL